MRFNTTFRALGVAAALSVALPALADAQFRSQQSANIPTTETLAQGNLLFEISHRFFPPINSGVDALWGFDGPVQNRLGLAYAATDRVLLGVLRTNAGDNLELNAKARLFEGGSEQMPVSLGAMGGVAWNMADPGASGAKDNEAQAYGQLMLNALLGDKLAIGVVPTVLRNPRIVDTTRETAFVVGVHAQAYLGQRTSLFGEWIFSESRPDLEFDTGTFGVEIQTRGHFFKIVVTNQIRMNPTQVLAGSLFKFKADQLRVGFNVTRRLSL